MKLLALVSLFAAVYSPVAALWPQPRTLNTGNSTLRLAPNFQISVSGAGAPADLWGAVARTESYLAKDQLGRLVVGRGASDAPTFAHAKTLPRLTVSLEKGAKYTSILSEAQKALAERDEAYLLTVPADGSAATLTANSTLGLYRGLTTFGQLWYEVDGTTYTNVAPLKVEDSPAYVRRSFPVRWWWLG